MPYPGLWATLGVWTKEMVVSTVGYSKGILCTSTIRVNSKTEKSKTLSHNPEHHD